MGKLEVANLTLTSDGRIIESNAKSGNEFETFERVCRTQCNVKYSKHEVYTIYWKA